jgi:predicted O-methyltransferase YrrM
MYTLEQLYQLAKAVEFQAWGCGESLLADTEAAPPYYRFLHGFVKKYKPKLVVECGTYLGVGAAHMAAAYIDTQVISIDLIPTVRAKRLADYYLNMHLWVCDTTDIHLCADLQRMNPIELLFLDSGHDGLIPRKELDNLKPALADQCLICCDDILDERMTDFWNSLEGDKMTMHFLHPATFPQFPDPGFGVSILRR